MIMKCGFVVSAVLAEEDQQTDQRLGIFNLLGTAREETRNVR